jgi:hypothetical protein
MLKIIFTISASALGNLSAFAGNTFSYDGHYEASEYDISFDIEYAYEMTTDNPTGIVKGGTIALTTHNGQQYMYISHPLGFKDLSYADKNDVNNKDYTVGWNNIAHGNNKLDGAIRSEHITLSLTNENDTYKVKFNPKYDAISPGNANETVVISGGNSATFGFLSTSDYNQSLFVNGLPTWFTQHSPETLKPIDIVNCTNEQSSDPSCYQLADINANKIGGELIDWNFNWGLEIKLNGANGGAFFEDVSSLNLEDFGYKTGDAIIRLDELHASDPKTLLTGHHNQGDCENGDTPPNHEPCGATVVNGPLGPQPVTEPSVIPLFGLGIFGIWYMRRKTALCKTPNNIQH